MSPSRFRLLSLLAALLLPLCVAHADDFDDLEDEGDDEGDDDEIDDAAIYQSYKNEVKGEDAAEEIDAWYRYLEAYTRSKYRMQIEQRIEALEDQGYDQAMEERVREERIDPADAKNAEMDLRSTSLLTLSPNTRKNFKVQMQWGYPKYINYDLAIEWAFKRQFSIFGGFQHKTAGFGTAVQIGAKYALIKDTRTGIILSGAVSALIGFGQLEKFAFKVQPWIGFGWIVNETFQIQSNLSMDLRLNRFHTEVTWDLMAVINPVPALGIYVENKMKNQLLPVKGLDIQYRGFHQAGVGVKLRPGDRFEFTIGANIPYGWRLWKDYKYFGVHAGAQIYFGK